MAGLKERGKPGCPVHLKTLQLIWGEPANTQSAGKPWERRRPRGCTHTHRTSTHTHNKLLWIHTGASAGGRRSHTDTCAPTHINCIDDNKISSQTQITNICSLFWRQHPCQHLPQMVNIDCLDYSEGEFWFKVNRLVEKNTEIQHYNINFLHYFLPQDRHLLAPVRISNPWEIKRGCFRAKSQTLYPRRLVICHFSLGRWHCVAYSARLNSCWFYVGALTRAVRRNYTAQVWKQTKSQKKRQKMQTAAELCVQCGWFFFF